MKKYEFCSAKQIYNFLLEGKDLYNPVLEIHLWEYNNDGAIAYALITENEAENIAKEMAKDNECWSANLGGRSYIIEADNADEYENESPEIFEANKKAALEYLGELLKDNPYDWYQADVSYLDKNIKNILFNGSNECELLLAKDNYVLLKRNTQYDPYVVAYAPKIALGKIEWGQGHYIHDFSNAIQIFKEKTNLNEKDIVVIKMGNGQYIQSINNTLYGIIPLENTVPPEKKFNYTNNLMEAKLFLHHDAYDVIPDDMEWIEKNKPKVCKLEMQMILQNNKTKPKAKLASREKLSNHQCLHR